MSYESGWYSAMPQNRFSLEHRKLLPAGAHMIDLDGLVYAPYVKGTYGGPLILVEFKPENAREDYADDRTHQITGYEVRQVGSDLTVLDWYRLVEQPLREKAGHRRAA